MTNFTFYIFYHNFLKTHNQGTGVLHWASKTRAKYTYFLTVVFLESKSLVETKIS